MINPSKMPPVTAVTDRDSGQITAYFNELPGLVVQGKSISDVRTKLISLLDSYIQRLDSIKTNLDIQTAPLI